MALASKHNPKAVEDAAPFLTTATSNPKALGVIEHMGCFNFHNTRGAVIVKNSALVARSEITCDNGNQSRSIFLGAKVKEDGWMNNGLRFIRSEIQAAYTFTVS